MTEEKLLIFGDSFSDENATFEYHGDQHWPKLIKKYYNVSNFSLCGSGPTRMLSYLLSYMNQESQTCADTKVLFLLSGVRRLSLLQAGPAGMAAVAGGRCDDSCTNDTFKCKCEHQSHLNWCLKYHLMSETFTDTETKKIICTLKCISEYFKKVVVMFCWYPDDEKYDMLVKNDEKFFISDRKKNLTDMFPSDTLIWPNHIQIERHKDVLNYMREMIDD